MIKNGCKHCCNGLPIGSGVNTAANLADVICIHSGALYVNLMGKQFNGAMTVINEINYCPMCGRKL